MDHGMIKKTNGKDDSTIFSPDYTYNGPRFLIQLKTPLVLKIMTAMRVHCGKLENIDKQKKQVHQSRRAMC